MTTLREAAQQALEALEWVQPCGTTGRGGIEARNKAITALRAALAEPRPIHECYGDCPTNPQTCPNPCNFEGRPRPVQEPVTRLFGTLPVYTAPPQRKPLSVTDLQDALVYTNLIDRDAIDDPDGYDEGATLAQIDELHRMLIT